MLSITISSNDNIIQTVMSAPTETLEQLPLEVGHYRIFALDSVFQNDLAGAIYISGVMNNEGVYQSLHFTPHPTTVGLWRSDGSQWINDDPSALPTLLMALVRNQRNQALMKSDWTQVLDAPISKDEREMWASWRNDLRNIPQLWPIPQEAKDKLTMILNAAPRSIS